MLGWAGASRSMTRWSRSRLWPSRAWIRRGLTPSDLRIYRSRREQSEDVAHEDLPVLRRRSRLVPSRRLLLLPLRGRRRLTGR